MLSTSELRAWCRAKTRRGRGKHLGEYDRDFSTLAFLRHIGWGNGEFYQWIAGRVPIPAEKARLMRRFVEDWEHGMVEFSKPGSTGRGRKAVVVHRQTPRPVARRLRMDLSGSAPRLTFLPKPARNVMPAFPDVARGFDKKRT